MFHTVGRGSTAVSAELQGGIYKVNVGALIFGFLLEEPIRVTIRATISKGVFRRP